MAHSLLLDTPAIRQELATTRPAIADAPGVASLLFDAAMTHAKGPLLRIYIELLNEMLRTRQAITRTDRLRLINLRHALLVRQETERLAADPVAQQHTAAAATSFARKAQSGFSPHPLPE